MAKRALLILKEVSGVASLATQLVSEFGYELLATEEAGIELEAKGIAFNAIEEEAAAATVADKSFEIVLVLANYLQVETVGRAFMSWKSAMAAFDRAIVETVRAAAWAADRMAVVGDPSKYHALLANLTANKGKPSQAFRVEHATLALRATSEFDFSVAQYLEVQGADAPDMGSLGGYPKALRMLWPRAQTLDTGENPHQQSALYGSFFEHFEIVAGGKLNYEAVLNVSRATHLIGEFEKPAAALLRRGQIVDAVCGRELDEIVSVLLARNELKQNWMITNYAISEDNLDTFLTGEGVGLIAPGFHDSNLQKLASSGSVLALKSKTGLGYAALQELRSVVGGALVQDKDRAAINPMEWTVASLVQPLVEDWESLLFAAKLARHANSSSVAIVRAEQLVILEAGRYSASQAWQNVEKRGMDLTDTIAVFDDPDLSAETLTRMKLFGVRAVLLPFGVNTDFLREAANECGLALLTMSRSMRRI